MMRRSLARPIGVLTLVALLTAACERRAPAAAGADASLPGVAAAPDSVADVVTERLIIYVAATDRELEALRDSVPEEDFAVIADDLMFYRATALEYLEQQRVPLASITGRRPLSFRVGDVIRRLDFADLQLLDFIIVYEPGREPATFAPNEVAEAVAALRARD